MKKLLDKSEVLFAVMWIVLYVVGFSAADGVSEAIGMPQVVTLALGAVMAAVLYLFIRRHGLQARYGLCRSGRSARRFLWYAPLLLICSVNLWNGLTLTCSVPQAIVHVLVMCLVAFLEEVIFRGLLFKGMSVSGLRSAIIVSSLTFGMGHIVNLLSGAPLVDTLLQLVYAAAVGFCFTAIFHVGGSILPCIIAHAVVNGTSIFAVEPSTPMLVFIAAVQTVVSVLYGVWLLRGEGKPFDETSGNQA